MTVGEGIVWSTVILVAFATVYFISKSRTWKLVGKVVGGLVAIGCAIGGGIWGWQEYQNRPQIIDELAGISFGMTPLEVRLAKGEPEIDIDPDSDRSPRMMYKDSLDYLMIYFSDSEDGITVNMVCSNDHQQEIFGLGEYDAEAAVLKKLGEPENTSVRNDGLAKVISYPKWNANYEIEKGWVTGVCISQNGPVTFSNEYKE